MQVAGLERELQAQANELEKALLQRDKVQEEAQASLSCTSRTDLFFPHFCP